MKSNQPKDQRLSAQASALAPNGRARHRRPLLTYALLTVIGLAMSVATVHGAPQSLSFSYQAELRQTGTPINGLPDLSFRLYDALSGGNQVAPEISAPLYPVQDGLLSIDLDFGAAAFDGNQRWLEVIVDGLAVTPRQAIRSTPYAMRAQGVVSGSVDTLALADAGIKAVDVDSAAIQLRINGGCTTGNAIRAIGADGSVQCENLPASGITSVTAGSGLVGGGSSGGVALAVAAGGIGTVELAPLAVSTSKLQDGAVTTSKIGNGQVGSTQLASASVGATKVDATQVQLRVAGACAAGSSIRSIDSAGAVSCEVASAGDITSVSAGTGLTGGGGSGDVSLAVANSGIGNLQLANAAVTAIKVDPAQVQLRVAASCAPGNSLRGINQDGTVVCDTLPTGLSRTPLAGSAQGNLAVAIAGDGLPILAYVDSGSGDPHVIKCGNPSCSSGNIDTNIDAVSGTGASTPAIDILVPPDGLPIVAYFEVSQQDLRYVRCGNINCSSGNTGLSLQTSGSIGLLPRLALTAAGNPAVVYLAQSPTRLMYTSCSSLSCASATTVTLATTPMVPANPAIVFNSSAQPISFFYDQTNQDLVAVTCSDASCASTATTVLVSTGNVGAFPAAINIGSASPKPTIAFRDASAGLRAVTCLTSSCAGASSVFAVDPDPNTGNYNSIALGANGAPLIVGDGGNGQITAASCGSISCNSHNIANVVDARNGPTTRVGIAVPADGNPVIAYSIGGSLFLTKCASWSCR